MSEALRAGYKLTEVGVIPEDWELSTLGDVAVIKDGTHQTPKYVPSGVPFFSVEHVTSGDFNKTKFISEQEHRFLTRSFKMEKGDILMTRIGSIGDCKLIDWDVDASFYVSLALLKIKPKYSSEFIAHYSKSAAFQSEIELHSLQSAIPRKINLGPISYVKILIPPQSEQLAIATALSDIDALLAKLDTLITKKRNIKQATMQQLLTGQTRLPGFGGEWEVKSFGEIFDYLPTATNARSDLSDVGDTYYVHYGDIHTRFHSHLDFRNQLPSMIWIKRCRNAALLKNGDWVMADASEDYDGVGKSIEISGLPEGVKAVAGLHTFLLREKTPTFATGFKGHLGNLKSLHHQYLKVATGMKVFGVSKKALSNLTIQIPSIKEQTAISSILSDIYTELATLESRRDKTLALKQGMMQELLTGRIRLI